MLAKVVKNHTVGGYAPFSVPEIGTAKPEYEKGASFIFPGVIEVARDFNHADETFFEPTADEILQNARQEAANIVAQAEQNASMIEAAARERGLQDARSEVQSQTAAQVDELRAQMTATIDRIAGLQTDIAARVEVELVEFALEIAKRIVGREVTIDREIAVALVKVSLNKLHDRSTAEVHLHPDDYEYVRTNRAKLEFKGALELVADASVSPGGCLIHTETGDIDARIESQFDEMSHGLLGK